MDDSEISVTDLSVSPESIATAVGGGNDGAVGGIQICPALTLGSTQALPIAAKHIYNRLADHAVEIDEGMPNMILSLVSNGNQLSENYLSRFQSALSVLVAGGGLWLVSSGEYRDPLARTASTALRAVLPQVCYVFQ
uniref:Late endosomal/lysosomal adaptor and MAPK and MTOR activator 4 n=1 Tax=Angiostrongylus cantonensis TaxID=6313 RepID=A0A0K0DRW4_ANGCA